jgi:hypothetical protein
MKLIVEPFELRIPSQNSRFLVPFVNNNFVVISRKRRLSRRQWYLAANPRGRGRGCHQLFIAFNFDRIKGCFEARGPLIFGQEHEVMQIRGRWITFPSAISGKIRVGALVVVGRRRETHAFQLGEGNLLALCLDAAGACMWQDVWQMYLCVHW